MQISRSSGSGLQWTPDPRCVPEWTLKQAQIRHTPRAKDQAPDQAVGRYGKLAAMVRSGHDRGGVVSLRARLAFTCGSPGQRGLLMTAVLCRLSPRRVEIGVLPSSSSTDLATPET
jgi:hypothetical protein